MSRIIRPESGRKRVVLSAECLEDRTVPAGNVTASVQDGVLMITGDARANHLRVAAADDGEVFVIPLGGTTVNGGGGMSFFAGVERGYNIQLREGDDFVWLTGTRGDAIVFVNTGAGNDGITMDYASHHGATIFSTGGGADTVSVGMGALANVTQMNMGAGDDRVFVAGGIFGKMNLDGGAGDNTASVTDAKLYVTPGMTGFRGTPQNGGRAPVAAPDSATVRHGSAVTVNVLANDTAPGGTLDTGSVTITGQPAHGTARVNSNGTVTYTADNSAATTDTFRYTVRNASGGVSNQGVVTLTLTASPTGDLVPTITTPASDPTNLAAIPFTVLFNRVVTGFDATDITVTNGTVSNFTAVSGRRFTFTVTPTTGTVTVSLAAGAAKDATNKESLAATKSLVADRTAPTAVLAGLPSSNPAVIPVRVTFSENVTGFSAADFVVTGGTASGFQMIDAKNYTVTVTPTGGTTPVRVSVAAGAAEDAAGNDSAAAQMFTSTPTRTDDGMTDTKPDPNDPNWQAKPDGLKVWDIQAGTGPAVTPASTLGVFYTGWLLDGTVFDSARTDGQPASFPLTGVIDGWQEGLLGMQPGGIRRLYIPAALAYGEAGRGNIPPNADLIFEVKLVSVS